MGVAEEREFGRVGFGREVRVSQACTGLWTRKQEEWSRYLTMTILAFLGSGRQLASVVVFVVVLLAQAWGRGGGVDIPKTGDRKKGGVP